MAKQDQNSSQKPDTRYDTEIDITAVLRVLWAGKAWIVLAVVLGLGVGIFSLLRTSPTYRADALLQLEKNAKSSALPSDIAGLFGAAPSSGKAEIALMQSRMVLGDVVNELDLQLEVTPKPLPILGLLPTRLGLPPIDLGFLHPYQWGPAKITIKEFELDSDWLDQTFELAVTGNDSYTLKIPKTAEYPAGRLFEGQTHQRLSIPEYGLTMVISEIDSPIGREFSVEKVNFVRAISEIRKKFSVSESSKDSDTLVLYYEDQNVKRAENILNKIAEVYLRQNIDRSSAEAQKSLDFIEAQLPVAQAEVAQAQNALNEYRQIQRSIDVAYETRALLERVNTTEKEISEISIKEEYLKKRYTNNHPIYQNLLQSKELLEKQLIALREETGNLPETQKEIFNLERNLEVAQQVYLQLLSRGQELRVIRASTVGSVRIIDTAVVAPIPVAPKNSQVLAIYLLAGAIIGCALVYIRYTLNRGVRSVQEIEKLGLPVFATMNYSSSIADHQRHKGDLPILALSNGDDLIVESLRSLRTSLHFGMLDAKNNSLLITSAAPAAGKSFTAVNLAVVAAQSGQKVCLIDADLRRGYLHRYFKKPRQIAGLSDYLSKVKTLDEVMFAGPVDGLSVISCGQYPPNPSELLMRPEFTALLKHLNEEYDLVIIDSPPTLAVTDPVIISRFAGASLLIVRHLRTMVGEIEAVQHRFETASVRLNGAVLNGYINSEADKQGNGQYYSYSYSYTTDNKD